MDAETTYTREELTEILKVSLTTVGTLINDGAIYSVRVGKSIRVPQWSLDDYLHGRPPYTPPEPLLQQDELGTPSLMDEED